jgi:hypothetical protein
MIAPLLAAAALALSHPCTASYLRPLGGNLNGATGTMAGFVAFRNRLSTVCRLGGVPSAVITTRAGIRLRTVRRLEHSGNGIAVAEPGERVMLPLDWANWCAKWSVPTTRLRTLVLHLRLTTGARLTVSFTTGRPRCDAPARASTLFVGRFTREV